MWLLPGRALVTDPSLSTSLGAQNLRTEGVSLLIYVGEPLSLKVAEGFSERNTGSTHQRVPQF